MFTAAERPRSIVLPMQLNRAPYWINVSWSNRPYGSAHCPLSLCSRRRMKEWKPEIQSRSRPCHLCCHSGPVSNGFTWDLLISQSQRSSIICHMMKYYITGSWAKQDKQMILSFSQCACLLIVLVWFSQSKAWYCSTVLQPFLRRLSTQHVNATGRLPKWVGNFHLDHHMMMK